MDLSAPIPGGRQGKSDWQFLVPLVVAGVLLTLDHRLNADQDQILTDEIPPLLTQR